LGQVKSTYKTGEKSYDKKIYPLPTAAAKRAFDAMMQMKKIDIAAIEAAYRG